MYKIWNRTERNQNLLLQNTDMNPGDMAINLHYLEQFVYAYGL